VTPEEYVEAVLDLVERIPAGRVMSYGAIADHLSDSSGRVSPRRVGTIMARYGGAVPWHRVVAANGRLVPGNEPEAAQRLAAEGVVLHRGRVPADRFWHPATPTPAAPADPW
jgi:alkylated DNA nucleotide flippase Atl1